MNQVAEQTNGSRKAEYFELGDGTFEVYCSVAGSASRAFHSKSYKTYKAARRRGAKFLEA